MIVTSTIFQYDVIKRFAKSIFAKVTVAVLYKLSNLSAPVNTILGHFCVTAGDDVVWTFELNHNLLKYKKQ